MKNSKFTTSVLLRFLLLEWICLGVAIQAVAGVLPSPRFFQDAGEVEVQNDFETHQQKALELELKRLKMEVGLEERNFEAIKEQVKNQLKAGAASIEKALDSNQIQSTCFLSHELADAIFGAAEKFVDKKEMTEYREDFEKFSRWEDRMARKFIIVFLDTNLELTSDQIIKIDNLLTENWKYQWNRKVFTMPFDAYSACSPAVDFFESDEADPNQISNLLTPAQNEIFSRIGEIGRGYSRVITGPFEKQQELVEFELELFLNRTIESLEANSKLDAKQKLRIKVAFKGVKARVLEIRRKDFSAYTNGNGLWSMSALMNSPFQQFRTQKIWQQAIARALSGNDREEFIRNEEQRQLRRLEISAIFPITYINRHYRLSYGDMMAIYDLATKKIVEDKETMIYRCVFSVFSIPVDELKNVVREKSFDAIKERWLAVSVWSKREEFEAADRRRAAEEERSEESDDTDAGE